MRGERRERQGRRPPKPSRGCEPAPEVEYVLPEAARVSDTDRIVAAIGVVATAVDNHAQSIIASINSQPGAGHFSMHVTAVDFKPQENQMPPIDVTPVLDLASASVRAKISVVDPKRTGSARVPSSEITWSLSEESEPGAGALEAAPDDTMKDEAGAEIIGEDGLAIPVYSTFANTPLEPAEGTRASFKVKASASGMADCTKVVSYGNAPVGHFTMVGVEAPEA